MQVFIETTELKAPLANQRVDIVLCLPGDPPTGFFHLNLVQIIMHMQVLGLLVTPQYRKSSSVYVTRNACLQMDISNQRVSQKPFDGKLDYKWLVWMDADNLASPDQIMRLISHDEDICFGWSYMSAPLECICEIEKTPDGKEIFQLHTECPVHKKGAQERQVNCGLAEAHKYHPYTRKELLWQPRNEKGLIETDFCGFALMVVKKGVFESLDFPWFAGPVETWEENGEQLAQVVSDDGGWCFRVLEKGYRLWVDPEVHVSHWKGRLY
jgi:hypothetical protein